MDAPLICHRCSALLTPGSGDHYLIRIEALADPTPPTITAADLAKNHQKAMNEIVSQMRTLSAQEAMDTVYRRLNLYLCRPCYRQWIEDPVASDANA